MGLLISSSREEKMMPAGKIGYILRADMRSWRDLFYIVGAVTSSAFCRRIVNTIESGSFDFVRTHNAMA